MTLLLSFGLLTSVWAAPIGDPVSHPETGTFHADIGLSMGQNREQDAECGTDACFATTKRSGLDVELGIAILGGFGVYGVYERHADEVPEVDYEGTLQAFGGGIRLALPLGNGSWLATTSQVRIGESRAKQASALDDPPSANEQIYSSSLLLVLGDPVAGGHCWIGPQAAWSWKHTVKPSGDEGVPIIVALAPRYPLSGVFGGVLTSDPLAGPWRNSPRIRVSGELRAGQEMGVRVATGLAF